MVGDRIHALRVRMGLSQTALGKMLGVTAMAVSKWERGQTEPGVDALRQLADIFCVTMDDLCDRPRTQQAPEVSVMARAMRRMTEEEREKLLALGRTMFEHAFVDESK